MEVDRRHRERRRLRLVLGVLGLFVAAGLWRLTFDLWEPGQSSADRATVLALPISILSAVLTVVSTVITVQEARSARDLALPARQLSRAIGDERQRFLDQALAAAWRAQPARVRFTDPAPAMLSQAAEALLLRWQDLDEAEAGSLAEIGRFYGDQRSGRLVVLGAPGAGKTVLLSRLTLDLLDRAGTAGPDAASAPSRVPVMLSVTTFDAGDGSRVSSSQLADRFRAWLITRLHTDYGLPVSQSRALVDDDHILPVLDGLDEMDAAPRGPAAASAPRPRAAALLQALNASPRRPVVLACRQLEYREVADPSAGTGPLAAAPVLTDARHVVIRPLAAPDIVSYLTARFPDRSGHLVPRWQPVADALRDATPLLAVLANPWQLFLAVTAYTQEDSVPAELTAMGVERVEAHLLDAFIPAVVDHSEVAEDRRWSSPEVRRWLTSIAVMQRRQAVRHGVSETDIALPDLWRVAGRDHPRWLPGFAAAAPILGLAVLAGLGGAPGWLVAAVAVASGPSLFFPFDGSPPLRRIDLHVSGGASRRSRILSAARYASLVGLVIGSTSALAFGGAGGLLAGLAAGVAGGVTSWMTADVAAVASVVVLARQSIGYTVAVGAAVGLTAGVTAGLIAGSSIGVGGGPRFGLVVGVVVAVTFGLSVGLWPGQGRVWLRYAFGVRSAARRGLLPARPAVFLDWCLDAGLMRFAGTELQFRHRRLQQALVATSASGDPGTADL